MRRQIPPSRIQYYLLVTELQLLNKEPNSALEIVEKTIQEASRLPQNALQVEALIIKAKILEEIGDYQSAYDITKTINNERDLQAERDKSYARISFKSNKNLLRLIIEDDGKGFVVDGDHQGNGLTNIKKRVSNIGKKCTLQVDSKAGKGTKWELTFSK